MKRKSKKSAAEKQWAVLTQRIARADKAAGAAQAALLAFVEAHLRKHPLSTATIAALDGRLRAGLPLCCKEGREYLATVVDPIWAAALNGWAYQSLSCKGAVPSDLAEYPAKLARIVTEPKTLARYDQ
jgi:hypothetical protein